MNSINTEDIKYLISTALKVKNKIIDSSRFFNTSESMKNFYNNYGYLSVKNLIPVKLLLEIQTELENILCLPPHTNSNEYDKIDAAIIELDRNNQTKLYELHLAISRSVVFKSVNLHLSKILKEISGIYSPIFEIASTILLGIPQDNRLVYDFHQESNYMKGFGDIFNIHYPLLRKSSIENGTMSIIPSSHKYGRLDYEKKKSSSNSYTDLIPKNIEKITSELPEIHLELELGDCIIFHKDLIHKSNFNESNLCRPVGIARLTQSLNGDWILKKSEEL
jgi:hypothetical protein